jgi:DNA-binding response OmpR family regulator
MRIVVISPFAAERSALEQLLRDDGHDVRATMTRQQGLDMASEAPPDAVIADAQIVGMDGPTLVRMLSARGLQPRVILLCPRAGRSFRKDGFVCLTKPIDLTELRAYLGEDNVEVRVA